jgi:hypothetical protein
VPTTVEKLHDPALVKQAALLLEQENARLHRRLQEPSGITLPGNVSPKLRQVNSSR